MRADVRHLLRNLRRSPVSAAAAVVTLSLTLGAGASIFAIVDAVLLTPPPFDDPESLVIVGETPLDEPAAAPRQVSFVTFEAWRERAGPMAALEASDGTTLTLTGLGAAERVAASNITPGLLPLLGVAPVLGRSFDDDDVGRPVALISDRFWRSRLAGDPNVIGRQIVLGAQPHTIVGVLPERLVAAFDRDVWRPFPVAPAEAARLGYRVMVFGRLAHPSGHRDLAIALDEVSRTSSPPARAVVTGLVKAIAGAAQRTLTPLAGAALVAIAIAFTNLTGLLLVRSIDRRRELAVRMALGARRADIVWQLVLEAQALVLAGIVGGVLLALWATPAVGRIALEFGAFANHDVTVSWRVIGTLAAIAALGGAVCGALPAMFAARQTVVGVLRGATTAPPRELAFRRALVAGEIALASMLLVSVTFVGASLRRVLAVSPGFDPHGVLALQVSLPAASYPDPERVASFYATLQIALQERLGDGAVSFVNEIPLAGDGGRRLVAVRSGHSGTAVVVREAGGAYFQVMRIPILAGRSFDARDDASIPPRVIVSRSLAVRLFGAEQPIGRRISLPSSQAADVIGVVGDVRHHHLDEPDSPTLYLAALQSPSRSSILVARSARPDADVIAAVREEVARLDRDVPVYGARPMPDVMAASPGVPERRVLTATFTCFGVLALALGAIGLFGVVAHDVARRRVELALRLALGAAPAQIVSTTLGQGAWMVGSGLAVGAVLSFWTTRALGVVLSPADRLDPVGIAAAAAVLVASAAAAVLPPALRAARTDPLEVLRAD